MSKELTRNEKLDIIEKEYEKAKQEGKLEDQIETVIKMCQKGFSEDKIAYILDKDEDEVRAILSGDIR